MIGTEGQYIFSLTIAERQDILAEGDLVMFKIQETAGNELPKFELAFFTSDHNLTKYLNEGNSVTIVMGRSVNDPERIETTLKIIIPEFTKYGNDKMYIHLLGVYNNIQYTNNPASQVTEPMSGLACVQKFASENWRYDGNPLISDDEERPWLKQFTTNKKMVDKALKHSLLENGVPISGITSSGIFRVRSTEVIKSANIAWNFTRQPKNSNDVYYDGEVNTVDNSSFNNAVLNYGRSTRVFDLESGTSYLVEYKGDTQLSQSRNLKRSDDITLLPGTNEWSSSTNQHPDWEYAATKNETELMSLGSVITSITVQGQYFPIKVLDTVSFTEKTIEGTGTITDTSVSGYRLTSRVCRTILNRQFSTYIEMAVENTNEAQGDFMDTNGIAAIESGLETSLRNPTSSMFNGTTSIISTSVGRLSNIYNTAYTPTYDAVKSIDVPEGYELTDAQIKSMVDSIVLDCHKKIISQVVELGDEIDDKNRQTITDIINNMVGSVAGNLSSLGKFSTEEVRDVSVYEDGGGAEKELSAFFENTFYLYNQPTDITEIPNAEIDSTLQKIASQLEMQNIRAASEITNSILGNNDDLVAHIDSLVSECVTNALREKLAALGLPEDYINSVISSVHDSLGETYDRLGIDLKVDASNFTNNIIDALDRAVTNALAAINDSGSISDRFDSSKKPGVMSPSTITDVWKCDGI